MNHDAALEVLIKPTVAKRYGLIAAGGLAANPLSAPPATR
jgi:hypothetical protein